MDQEEYQNDPEWRRLSVLQANIEADLANKWRRLSVLQANIEADLANIAANIEANLANLRSRVRSPDVLAAAAAAAAAAPAMANTTTLEVKTESECEQCSICQDYYIVGTILRQLPCEHKFHDECVSEWIHKPSSIRNCPVCRYQL